MSEEERDAWRARDLKGKQDSWAVMRKEERMAFRVRHYAVQQVYVARVIEQTRYLAHRCNLDFFDPSTNAFFSANRIEAFVVGACKKVCEFCKALGYNAENKARKQGSFHFGILCCNQGKIKIPSLPSLHDPSLTPVQGRAVDELYHLFVDDSKEARYFRNNIRMFNSGISMASLQVNDATV
jgi:hypothetical protein